MKRSLMFLLLIFASQVFAETLVCDYAAVFSAQSYGDGFHDVLQLKCEGSDSKMRYEVQIEGEGLTRRNEAYSKVAMICPFFEGAELLGTYYGAKIEGSIGVGVKAAIFLNGSRSCILNGINLLAIGAALTGSTMEITEAR